jgi:23S rRNA pseudouridine1911/1915/1917 synthase
MEKECDKSAECQRFQTSMSTTATDIPQTIGHVTLLAAAEDGGQRLDRFLAARLTGLTRSRIQVLIRAGHVVVANRSVGDPAAKVRPGETYTVDVPAPEPAEPEPEAMALSIVYEDADLIVIDKPAGLVVHPAHGHRTGTLVNALIAHCGASLSGIGGVRRPGIVHRLDKETSGVLVVAKSDAAHVGLSRQFAAHGTDGRLERAYLALCWGVPERRRGAIDAPLARSPVSRTRMAVVDRPHARRAVTHYDVVEVFPAAGGRPVASLVRLKLETGRTHQIRVHLAHISHPVMGDPVYGAGFKASARLLTAGAQEALARLGRQALHAAELGFEHPISGLRLRFESKVPADMSRLAAALKAPTGRRAK